MDKDAPNSSSSPSKVYAFWKDFDLEKEKLYISEKRMKLKENKESSIKKQKLWGVGSADLEATSAGATSDEASAKATSAETSLLLDYKSEINRADEAEKAFIELSDKICRAVDPFPVLSIYREENKRIKWDFSEVKVQKGFEALYDDSKEKEPRFLRDYIVKKTLDRTAIDPFYSTDACEWGQSPLDEVLNMVGRHSLLIQYAYMVRYRVICRFCRFNYPGRGGFGIVFECQKRIDKQMYAVKKIPIEDNEK